MTHVNKVNSLFLLIWGLIELTLGLGTCVWGVINFFNESGLSAFNAGIIAFMGIALSLDGLRFLIHWKKIL